MSQNYSNHRRWVPLYHFVAGPVLLVNFGYSVYHLIKAQNFDTVLGVLVAFALVVVFFCARVFANKVQDRVIRLEMRLRLANVLPPDMRGRINELTPDQLVGLRFACDAELPALTKKALEGMGREDIKKQVKTWEPDELRA